MRFESVTEEGPDSKTGSLRGPTWKPLDTGLDTVPVDSHESVFKEADEDGDEAGPDTIILKTLHCKCCILPVKRFRPVDECPYHCIVLSTS